jgi:addiction module HigA family antidote
MESLGLTQKQLAEALGITRVGVNAIIDGKQVITADTAFRMSRYFGAEQGFWLNLQRNVVDRDTFQAYGHDYERIGSGATGAAGTNFSGFR